MQILTTKNYELFKVIVSNREVDKNHVKRLAKSIARKNLLYIRPVIVNNSMEVIDGQHHIAACELVNEEVHYIQVPQLNKEDIAILNTAQKNWTRMDFVNFYAIEGRESYKVLSHFINKYPLIKISTFLSFCAERGNKLREGNLVVNNRERIEQVCDWLMQLHGAGFKFVTEVDFTVALGFLIRTVSDFQKLLNAGDKLQKCSSRPEYERMIKALVKE